MCRGNLRAGGAHMGESTTDGAAKGGGSGGVAAYWSEEGAKFYGRCAVGGYWGIQGAVKFGVER